MLRVRWGGSRGERDEEAERAAAMNANRESAGILAGLLRVSTDGPSPIFLLGAGASFRIGCSDGG